MKLQQRNNNKLWRNRSITCKRTSVPTLSDCYLSWESHPWARTGTVCGTASCTCWQSVQRDRAESWAAPWRTGLPARRLRHHQNHHCLRRRRRHLHRLQLLHRRPLCHLWLRSPPTPPSPSMGASSAPGSARWRRTHTHTHAHPGPGARRCKTHTVRPVAGQ